MTALRAAEASDDLLSSWGDDGPSDAELAAANARSDAPPPEDPDEQQAPAASSWADQDLTDVADGTHEPLLPTVGLRDDGIALLYPGRVHSLAGESEAGKTMLALHLVAQELKASREVTYIDLEDHKSGIVQRLLDMGLTSKQIVGPLHYKNPEAAFTDADEAALTAELQRCGLIVIDAATEALAVYGLSSQSDTEVAAFYRALPRRLADISGAPVLVLDHVNKDVESRGRYATGSQHKLSAITGAAYTLEAIHPFAVGTAGRSRLLVMKDRGGQVRPHSQRITGPKDWIADFTVDPLTPGHSAIDSALIPPTIEAREFKPTVLMERVSKALEKAGKPLGSRDLLARVDGRDEQIRRAIAALEDDGHLTVESGPRNARLHVLIKPYPNPPE